MRVEDGDSFGRSKNLLEERELGLNTEAAVTNRGVRIHTLRMQSMHPVNTPSPTEFVIGFESFKHTDTHR